MRAAATSLCVLSLIAAAPRATAQPPAPAPAKQDGVQRPFGPGQRVEVSCDEPDAYVYVAQGVVDERSAYPDPFKKVGRIPVQLELPPGVYTVLVEGERIATASTVFEVRQQPVSVSVHAGSQGLRDLATLSLAVGATALVAGGVIEVSGTGEGDNEKKRKITIPLFIAGGVTFAGGLAMYFSSSSSIEHNGFVPPQTGRNDARTHVLGIAGRF